MILDSYAAYLLAKKQAEQTNEQWEVWSTPEGFAINSVNERSFPNGMMHIIIVNPHTATFTREEYMRWL